MNAKSWAHASLRGFDGLKYRSEQSCHTLKVLSEMTSRESWWYCSRTAAILLLQSNIYIIMLEKSSDCNMKADNFSIKYFGSRVKTGSEHFGLCFRVRRWADVKLNMFSQSLSHEELSGLLLFNLAFSTARPRFLFKRARKNWLKFDIPPTNNSVIIFILVLKVHFKGTYSDY